MTKEMVLLVGLAIVVSILAAVVQSRPWKRRASGDIKPKKLLTEREQPMFFRLRQAFPEDVVLTQVAFSALLTAKDLPNPPTLQPKGRRFRRRDEGLRGVCRHRARRCEPPWA